ncbi:MAG: hypothetical protein K2X66_09965 [Cyanobacteria bacterium]|nr:hypothetical protein [Cyanobacteriota bacterium]
MTPSFRPGFSLIETAMAMLLVFVSAAVLIKMVGGTKVEVVGPDGNPYGSVNQLTSYMDRQFLFARSNIEDIQSGNLFPLTNSGPCSINLATLQGDATAQSPVVCRNDFQAKPIFYGWSVRKVVNGNQNPNLNYTGFSPNPGFPENDAAIASGFSAGPEMTVPRGNDFYQASLNIYSADGPTANQAPRYSIPFNFFNNTNPPQQIQAKLSAMISLDSSGSMQEADAVNAITRFTWAKEGLRSFLDQTTNDIYVDKRSGIGLSNFNLNSVTQSAPSVSTANNNFGFIRDRISCMAPVDIDNNGNNECPSNNVIIPQGSTALYTGLMGGNVAQSGAGISAIDLINQYIGSGSLRSPDDIVANDADRLVVWVTDGNNESSAWLPAFPGATAQDFVNNTRQNLLAIPRINRPTYFILGIINPNSPVLGQIADATPSGLYVEVGNLANLSQALEQVESQFQFFALRRKAQRWNIPIRM